MFFELENDNPFLTLEWQGTVEKTIQEYKDIKSNARLRIRSDVEITQFDIQELHKELKATKSPLEITYKIWKLTISHSRITTRLYLQNI